MVKSIKKEMLIGEVVHKYPKSVSIMLQYGLHCVGCHVAANETIEQGALAHGLSKKDIDKMIEDMNKVISKK